MNEKNLVQNNERTPSELRENGRKGGVTSGQRRREKRNMRETLKELLSLPAADTVKNNPAMKAVLGETEDVTNACVVLAGQILAAVKGNTNAAAFIRDTIGEKPADTVNMNVPQVENPYAGLSTEDLKKLADELE